MSGQRQRKRKPRVAIVGAGVVGLTVATCLYEACGDQLDLTILADRFSPDTTSDRAGADLLGGIWWFGDEQRKRWFSASLRRFEQLYDSLSPDLRKEIGLRKVNGYRLYRDPPSHPWCLEELPKYFKKLSEEEVKALGPAYDGCTVYQSVTFLLKCSRYLPWLTGKLRAKGALIIRRRIENLGELSDYDIVINCTGLRSYELVGDKEIHPVHGQSVVVKAPSINRFNTLADSDATKIMYIFPYEDHVIIGGTKEPNKWSTIPDPDTNQDIVQRCSKFEPCLREAEVIGGWACLRPTREPVRLEVEDPSVSPTVIHNYGHGGLGVVLSWGCAMDTVALVQQSFRQKGLSVSAKL